MLAWPSPNLFSPLQVAGDHDAGCADMTNMQIAEDFVTKVIAAADRDGENYSPDFRDYLSDNRGWVECMLADLLDAISRQHS